MFPNTSLGCVAIAQSSLFTLWLASNTTAERATCSVPGHRGIYVPVVSASRLQSSGDHHGVPQTGSHRRARGFRLMSEGPGRRIWVSTSRDATMPCGPVSDLLGQGVPLWHVSKEDERPTAHPFRLNLRVGLDLSLRGRCVNISRRCRSGWLPISVASDFRNRRSEVETAQH